MSRPAQFPPKIQQHQTAAEKAAGKPGRARVRVRGKDIALGQWGSAEANAAYRRLVAELSVDGGPAVVTGDVLTVAQLVARHQEAEHERSPKEQAQFAYACAPLVALYGPEPATAIDAAALEAVRDAMASGLWMTELEKAREQTRGRKVGWCRNVCNRRLTRIKTLWRWAERKKLVPAGAHANLKTVPGLGKGSRKVRHTADRAAADLETARKVARHAPPVVAAMLELQALVGMRSCEVRVMRSVDVDRSGDVWTYRPTADKSAWREHQAPRTVPLGPECQRILGFWLRPDEPEAYLFSPKGGRSSRACYSDTGYAQAVRRAAAAAGVRLQPYGTRHGAKRRITREHGADAARAVLGQKHISTTELYGGIDVDHAKEVARKIG